MVVLRALALAAGLVAAADAAQAHVVIQPKAVPSGYKVLRFVVGHGCDGQATTRVSINIPPIVELARPQPKAGWKLKIERRPDDPKRVNLVSWTGRLPADQFDEFLLQVKLPAHSRGTAFPTVQSCGRTHVPWTGADPAHPPPSIIITPADAEPGHHHQDKP